jgi:hypothetical protein
MNTSIDGSKLYPNEMTLFSVNSCDGVDNYLAADVRAEFRGVADSFEKDVLTKIVEALPTLLPVLDEPDAVERIKHFCRALQMENWQPNAHSEMLLNGRMEIERFFKEVPLLTEDEARQRLPSTATFSLPELMQLTYNGHTFYFADQFASDGSIHPECIECWRILRSTSLNHEWDAAMWWIYSNGWLYGRPSPRDVYKESAEALIHAAEQDVAKYEV